MRCVVVIAFRTVDSETKDFVAIGAAAKLTKKVQGSAASVPGSMVQSVSGRLILAMRLVLNPTFPSSDLPRTTLAAGAATTGPRHTRL